jgi:hypothetical protein
MDFIGILIVKNCGNRRSVNGKKDKGSYILSEGRNLHFDEESVQYDQV